MQNESSHAVSLTILVMGAFLCWTPSAFAVLGGRPMQSPPGSTSIVIDNSAARAPTSAASNESRAFAASMLAAMPYSVKETKLPDGTAVREYLSPTDSVFAIAWNGPRVPDLAALLGDYFPQYLKGAAAQYKAMPSLSFVVVKQPGLVVSTGGRIGAFSGRAWIPQALPSGVTPRNLH
ncbi:DUF2844 domain-containing protein [Burkholderia ambifaria]|uniref:DUF2844 domain-containing protein n=1 Tax=Burkholderia ambifaria MEX-5 TaxID=396597 RepID=B1T1G5_9BURK|nr:DUF2844 domain-containing protein [Burkholderia ambifaria]EDT42598.1 conserved hypothetical protein [Burkholderia ambifaria MEX-5]